MATVILNGIPLPSGAQVSVGRFRLTKAGRTASGKMVMDVIATKTKVDLSWDKLPEADLRALITALEAQVFYQLSYPDARDNTGQATITAYTGDINYSAWHRVNGVRYWESIKVSLIEQ